MKYWLLIALLLTGCGVEVESSTGGIFVDDSLVESLRDDYDDVQACTGMVGGSFDGLHIIMMPLLFACEYSVHGCVGQFEAYNQIYISTPTVFKHEIIHYLLYANTGEADPLHDGPYWGVCE